MVHRSMRNDSRVSDELYRKRGCFVLEDFHFLSLYIFSEIAKQQTILKTSFAIVLSGFLDMIMECFCLGSGDTVLFQISHTPDPTCYTLGHTVRSLHEDSQDLRLCQLFCNDCLVIFTQPPGKKINMVFCRFWVSMYRFDTYYNMVGSYVGCTAVGPMDSEINRRK